MPINNKTVHYLGLDIGEKRIGVSYAGSSVPIAVPLSTLRVDGNEQEQLMSIIKDKDISVVVVGYPRSQQGDPTAQTTIVQDIAARLLADFSGCIEFQDESLTSVTAEQHLTNSGKPYQKEDIDAAAASIILQDYLEEKGI